VATRAAIEALPARAAATGRARRTACFPTHLPANPYVDLLYDALAPHGIERATDPRFTVRWLARNRHLVSVVHVHWPEGLYRVSRRLPAPADRAAAALKLALFRVRLGAARLLRYRIVWTVHQPLPHERLPRDLIAARALARASHALIAHDRATAARTAAVVGVPAESIRIIRHGSYEGVYRETHGRDETRRRLGIAPTARVFLCFGEIRGYKSTGALLDAWRSAGLVDAVLVVAGHPKDPQAVDALGSADDPSLRLLLQRVPDAEVADLHAAADVVVLPRRDGGTSGALVLALTLGKPVVAADVPAVRETLGDRGAGWLFDPGTDGSLAAALREAHAGARAAGPPAAAREAGRELAWPPLAAATADVLAGGAE
jgi:beta-1,4-mannosyltransferase